MGYTVIAPVGDNLEAIFVGIKEFPTERIILITPPDRINDAKKLKKKLEDFTIPTSIIEANGNFMEEIFKIFGNICSLYKNDELLVNVATGDRISTCAALSASYANGLQAFGIMGTKSMLMPIMRLSYYNSISDVKLQLCKNLQQMGEVTLAELGDKSKVSLSLLSYHVHGTKQHKGLEQLRLVELNNSAKLATIRLSTLGKLLIKGYVKQAE